MDNVVLQVQDLVEVSCEPLESPVRELSDLHLTLVGGGCGEISAN